MSLTCYETCICSRQQALGLSEEYIWTPCLYAKIF